MATKKELEELGRRFIDLEIEILNKTNVSIFDNGIYNEEYKQIKEWNTGIKEFLTFDKENSTNADTRYYFNGLINTVNSYYMQYKENINKFDRINLKVYLQISEILEQEQKIIDLKRYRESQEVIEAQEHLNNIVLSSYTNQLKLIETVVKDNKLKEAIKVVVNGKNEEDIKKSFTNEQWKTFEHLYNLVKPENKDKLQKEIQEAQKSIKEAKERQKHYDQKKKANKEVEELEKSNTTAINFFRNNKAVNSIITLLKDCCDYFYNLIFINEFMSSLTILDIKNQFYFIKPLDLMSYSKLQGGIEDLMTVLEAQNIRNKDFSNIAYKYISLELFDKNSLYSLTDNGKQVRNFYKDILYSLRKKTIDMLENKNNVIDSVFSLETEFKNHLKEEKRW